MAFDTKLAEEAPAEMVTDGGTVRFALLADRAMTAPPLGAAALNVAVQVVLPGVLMVTGVHVKLVMVWGATAAVRLRVADWDAPP